MGATVDSSYAGNAFIRRLKWQKCETVRRRLEREPDAFAAVGLIMKLRGVHARGGSAWPDGMGSLFEVLRST